MTMLMLIRMMMVMTMLMMIRMLIDDGEDKGGDEEDDLSLQAPVGEVEVYREKGVGHHICYKNWNTNLKFSNRSN